MSNWPSFSLLFFFFALQEELAEEEDVEMEVEDEDEEDEEEDEEEEEEEGETEGEKEQEETETKEEEEVEPSKVNDLNTEVQDMVEGVSIQCLSPNHKGIYLSKATGIENNIIQILSRNLPY